jgi:hypothetical protein
VTLIIIIVFLLILAAAGFMAIVSSVIKKSCPTCGPEQFVAPIIPGVLAWCPECGESYRQGQLLDTSGNPEEFDERPASEPQEPAAEQAVIDPELLIIDDHQQLAAPEDPAGPPRF